MPESAGPSPKPSPQVALTRSATSIDLGESDRIAQSISRALRRAANKSRAPVSLISGGGGFQARRGDRVFRYGLIASFIALVVLPLFGASLYWGLIASKQYVTESKFALRAGEPSLLETMAGTPSASQTQDSQVVVNYIRSRAMVEALDKKLNLRAMYSRDTIDYFSRMDPDDSLEDLEKYWKKRLDANLDLMSGIITVNVRAFTPQDSLAIMENIVELSEKLVNELSTRSRRDALNLARTELTRAEDQLKNATKMMREARDAEGVLDATSAADAVTKVITQLRMELANAEESLALQKSAAVIHSPQTRLLEAQVRNLKTQIEQYSAQIASAGEKDGGTLARHAGVLSTHQIELSVAQQRYTLASAAYENARVTLETQRAYLSAFLRPTLAEKSIYPRRWLEWAIIVAPATVSWGILVAIAFLVRDHMAK